MRPLIRRYRWIVRWRKTLKKFIKHGLDYNFEESVRLMEADRMRLSQKIKSSLNKYPASLFMRRFVGGFARSLGSKIVLNWLYWCWSFHFISP